MRTASTLILTFSSQIYFHRVFSLALAAFTMFFSTVPDCAAQESAPPQQVIQVSTELVKLDVTVLDKNGDFAGGLEKKDFRVLDGGVAQPILFFAPMDSPAQILVLIETSPAVFLIRADHIAATYALLDGLAADDQIALATYDQSPHVILPFTTDKRALLAAFGGMQYRLGMDQLNFYDSISAVMDMMPAEGGKRALVLLTTGLDSSAPERWDALVKKLRAEDVVIYSVALGGSLRNYTGKKAPAGNKTAKKSPQVPAASSESVSDSTGSLSFARANDALLSLAKITGGRAYFPEKQEDFVSFYHQIAAALRHQYVLGIAPEHDGAFHALTVQVLGANGQPIPPATKKAENRIYAREGYLAPGP
jgi:VWFA-related protein